MDADVGGDGEFVEYLEESGVGVEVLLNEGYF